VGLLGLKVLHLVLLVLLEVTVVFVRLTFPPAAVYHARKMHCHEEVTGHNREAA